MNMKRILYKITSTVFIALFVVGGMSSCTDYLDKEEGTDVDPEAAFKNYTNFQGFVDAVYSGIPHKETNYWQTTFNWGEDEIVSVSEQGNKTFSTQLDNGNYWPWITGETLTYLNQGNTGPIQDGRQNAHLWNVMWGNIRVCNLGLANLDKITATEEEKNTIAGQLYFFRAWYYSEMMFYVGGLPYITEVPSASEKLTYPRLPFQECAKLAAEDFGKAAELLPANWDESAVGRKTMGQNDLRVTQATALGYQGKMLLWAASPLSVHGPQLGGTHTYDYDVELAKQAADVLGECISLIESGKTPYALAQFDYADIYNHEKSRSASSCYSEIFFTKNQSSLQPGSTEAMMRGPKGGKNDDVGWHFGTLWGSNVQGLFQGDMAFAPTANYVNYAYGTDDGLPLNDPDSKFDPKHPFKNRDPRFYHDIVFDGFLYINTTPTGYEKEKYCTLYTNGYQRDAQYGSRSGYFCQKLIPHTANKLDLDGRGAKNNPKCYLPYMRVADIYLMYAEAGAAIEGSNYKSTSCSRSAVDAINVLRDRVKVAHVNDKFLGDKIKFMDEVRRERACELAFEGFRFNDLQRWLLLTEYPYNVKTSQEFTRVNKDEWYEDEANDPRDAEVAGWSEKVILTRNFGTKHYWFPLPDDQVHFYEDYSQNPGW